MIIDNPKISKVLAAVVCALFSLTMFSGVYAQGTTVNANASDSQPAVGSTLTVTVQIANVQNLFGLDITLTWDPSVLTLSTSDLTLGVESHPNGVLHGTQLNYDFNTVVSGDIYVNVTQVTGSYDVSATSVGSATAAFSGTGTVVTLQFTVNKAGDANIVLSSDLSDKPEAGGISNLIDHTDNAATVNAVTSNSNNPTSTTPTQTATDTPQQPDQSSPPFIVFGVLGVEVLAVASILVVIVAVVLVVVLRKRKTQSPPPPYL